MRQPTPPQPASTPTMERLEARQLMSAAPGGFVTQTNLTTDGFLPAAHTDVNLKNPWGVSFSPAGEFWVSDNNSGKSTLYDGVGTPDPNLVVNIPGPGGNAGTPTGQVYTGANGFAVHEGNGAAAGSQFVFVNEDGVISGWSPSVDIHNAVVAVDNSASGAVYKGAALAQVNAQPELFVTNFNSGQVEVYNSSFGRVQLSAKAFQDRAAKGLSPFNIQNIDGLLYVTYAKPNAARHDDVGGAGSGLVDVFNTRGKLLRHLQRGTFLNSPWAVAAAPSTWGKLAGDILVGQFKSGQIEVFSRSGRWVGALSDQNKNPIAISGLWALTPGTGSATASADTIYFTAGSNEEADGLFGSLTFTAVTKPTHHSIATSGGTLY